jgi:hypothetical protein
VTGIVVAVGAGKDENTELHEVKISILPALSVVRARCSSCNEPLSGIGVLRLRAMRCAGAVVFGFVHALVRLGWFALEVLVGVSRGASPSPPDFGS